MPDDRKYVRVYYNDLIRDYPDVWDDDAQLATWLRMLSTADPLWPTPPELPRSVKARPLAALVNASLVETLPRQRFRMKGMDAERTKRADAARNAAASRWQSDGNAAGNAKPMPKRAEQSKAENEQSKADADALPPDEPHDPWDAPEQEAIAWLARHGCSVVPGNGYHRQLITAVERHGVNAIVGMMDRLAAAGTKQGDLQGFLFGAINAVDKASRPNLTELDKEDRASESRDARRRGVERTKRLAHENGFHREEPSPGCPACSVEVPA